MLKTSARLALLPAIVLAAAAANAQAPADDAVARAEAAVIAGDPGRALQILSAAAAAGDSDAAAELGDIYRDGVLLPQDFASALQWYEAAGETHAGALNARGRLIFEGLGATRDLNEALRLLGRAARLNADPSHAFDYAAALEARASSGDLAAAADWYARAADAGHAPAMTSLGVLYLEGRGADADAERALALFERAADAGDARGLNNLGLLHARGDAVEQDYGRAAELFRAAADQGLPSAMTNLAVLYENGFGVELDEAEAIRLYRAAGSSGRERFEDLAESLMSAWSIRLAPFDPSPQAAARDAAAAAAGDPIGLYALGFRFANGIDRPADPARAAEFYSQAAEAGFAPAALGLGVLYVRGLGVPQDYVEAYDQLAFAAAAGEGGAAELRDALLERMGEAQRARALQVARRGN